MTRRYATEKDFKENIDVLMDVWNTYKKLYDKEIVKRKGIISIDRIDELIIEAKQIVGTKDENEIAVEGFFDGYVGIFTSVLDSRVVHRAVDMQLSQLKEEV